MLEMNSRISPTSLSRPLVIRSRAFSHLFDPCLLRGPHADVFLKVFAVKSDMVLLAESGLPQGKFCRNCM